MWLLNKSINQNDTSKIKEYNKLKIEIKQDIKNIKNSVSKFESNIAKKFKTQPKYLSI